MSAQPTSSAASGSLATRIASGLGIARSLALYHLRPGHRRRLDAHYRRFIAPGELAFDVGAHVGDRTASFRRLGARVVAVEPQPPLAQLLRRLHGSDRQVTLETCAISDAAGEMDLHVNTRNPTVSTLSSDFVKAAHATEHWQGQQWDRVVRVQVKTLDDLVARHGLPAFVKIDIEGAEYAALKGLSQPVRTLSVEFTTIQRDVAAACLDRLAEMGPYRFNATLGESFEFVHADGQSAEALKAWLQALPVEANSGDLYASLAPELLRQEG